MRKYLPQEFEKKWADVWDKEKIYSAGQPSDKKQKKYVLDMFPYPSGAGLHVGHPRGYVGTDIVSRFYRMMGYNVLHPMGWDAFGLPAENAAIKAKKNPVEITKENIANFKRQLKMLGFSYDWDKELATTDPGYYKWTQYLFLQFYKMGLLYKKMTPVYYCPFCKTGLAQEEVLPNNTHERCQKEIVMKDLPQWIFKITSYADRLLTELDGLDWPSGILEMQRNWIGRKEGINITYEIKGTDEKIVCFTTRPDTNFGATFVVIAPTHPFAKAIREGKMKVSEETRKAVEEYSTKVMAKSDEEKLKEGRKKTGVFSGFYAVNNLNGREMPLWVSDFVVSGFGTEAVVGVPGHDMRDFEFADTFGIEVIRVVEGSDGDTSPITKPEQVQEEEGKMINSDFLNGMEIHDATKKIMDYMEEKKYGERVVSYHLRDWIFSRQRYWGEPIPMVFCKACSDQKISWWDTKNGEAFLKEHKNISKVDKKLQENQYGWFPIDEQSLPLELPYLESYEPNETGESPLAKVTNWIQTTCPNCGGKAERESDTMPNWAGSCWYFLRFADPHNDKEAWSKKSINWQPVDWYIGGAEHAVLHLLYARFWVKALQDLKMLDFNEPFLKLRNIGMVLAEDHRKMSKSLGNVINPDDVVNEYGADALRVYEMFMAPFNQEIPWSTASLQGTYRFLKRVWDMCQKYKEGDIKTEDKALVVKLQKTIAKVSQDIQETKFNTAVAAMMEFINAWEASKEGLSKENAKKFVKILAPYAAFMTEEIWREVFGEKDSIHRSKWPEVDKAALVDEEVKVPVQVSGKVRAVITIPAGETSKEVMVEKALQEEKVKQFIGGKKYEVIYVPGKILNFVVKSSSGG